MDNDDYKQRYVNDENKSPPRLSGDKGEEEEEFIKTVKTLKSTHK